MRFSAMQLTTSQDGDGVSPSTIKLQEVKAIRSTASEITQSGARLYDLLASESVDRADRVQAIRYLESVATAQGMKIYTICLQNFIFLD